MRCAVVGCGSLGARMSLPGNVRLCRGHALAWLGSGEKDRVREMSPSNRAQRARVALCDFLRRIEQEKTTAPRLVIEGP